MIVVLQLLGKALAAVALLFAAGRLLPYLGLRLKEHRNGCSSPPRYPHKDPIFGLDLFSADLRARKEGNAAAVARQRFRDCGRTYEVNNWGSRMLHTMDKENIRTVLAASFGRFGVETMRLAVGKPFIGPGVFSTDGPYWRHSRALIRPIFARKEISNFKRLDVHLDRMLEQIPQDGKTVELQSLLKLLFLDHSTEMIFGQSTDTLLRPNLSGEANPLLVSYSAALKRLGLRIILGRLRIFNMWDTVYQDRSKEVHAVVDTYIDAAIEKHTVHDTDSESADRYIIVDELVASGVPREEIRDQLINIFLPAHDSIAIGLSGVLFHLARQPDIWDRLRAEVLDTVKNNSEITYAVLQSMVYMKAVLNESLRLLAPASRNIRQCTADTLLPYGGGKDGQSPVYMRKGDTVNVNFGAMHMDKDLWGDDALEFKPERWLQHSESKSSFGHELADEERPGSTQLALKPGWAYIPFSGGPRICPGQQITLAESAYVLVRLMIKFTKMENRDPQWEFIEENQLTVESRNGVLVSLQA